MMLKPVIASLFLLLSFGLQAQPHQPIFLDLEGQELLQTLKENYKPNSIPSSSFAKDVLYSEIYNVNDYVSCVYTGFTIYMSSGDPSEVAFDAGINAEHTLPRTYLEGSTGEYDIHNLYPTRANVNADRGVFPFAEIPDDLTTSWYYLDSEIANTPINNIDLYSELVNGFFEPREDHKGNIARTMMYMYTMYGDVVENNAPDFFASQRENLCAWHLADPVDEAEYNRTYAIASYQSNKPNPFVLDCTLAKRAFCSDGTPCTPNNVDEINVFLNDLNLRAVNPFFEQTTISYELSETATVSFEIYNAQGRLIQTIPFENRQTGHYSFDLTVNGNNFYILLCKITTDEHSYATTLKLVSLK